MTMMGERLGRWGTYCLMLGGCSTWVDLESPAKDSPEQHGNGGTSVSGAGQKPSAGAAGGVTTAEPPGGGPVGGTSTGGSTSAVGSTNVGGEDAAGDGGGGTGPDPGLFEPLDPPSPAIIPAGATIPDVTWGSSTAITVGRLDGALAGVHNYYFRRDTSPEGSYEWMSGEPFVWTNSGGMVVLDRLLPGVELYEPAYVNADGSLVMGTYMTSSAGDETGIFRWTRAGGATKLGPAGSLAAAVGFWSSETGDVVLLRVPQPDSSEKFIRWAAASGFRTISDEPGWPAEASIERLSPDGSAIFGAAFATSGAQDKLFRWTEAGVEMLGGLPGLTNCYAGVRHTSRDGNVAFGACTADNTDSSTRKAFRWSASEGMTPLENQDKSCYMDYPEQMSGDGAVVFGRARCGTEWRLMRWSVGTSSTVPAAAAAGLSFENVYLAGADAPGNSVCGSVFAPSPSADESPAVAFRWSANAGYTPLALATGEDDGEPRAIDSTGNVIVGFSGSVQQRKHAMLWDTSGALDITAYLTAHGVNLQDRPLYGGSDVAIQGNTILVRGVGALDHPRRDWIARIPLVR